MNEQYLHLIWKLKRLPFHQINTVNNESIEVLDVGEHNGDSGPDFFNGQIILHGIRHHGNIELHVRSSDWYLHKHQQDAAYDSVILHVVYEYDQPVFVRGKELPTIELKPYIDWAHYNRLNRAVPDKDRIICAHAIHDVSKETRNSQWETMVRQRLQRKSRELFLDDRPDLSLHQFLIRAFAAAFGAKTNALPFRELANNLPHEKLLKASLFEKTAIIFGLAGFLNDTPADDYHAQLTREWRFQKHKFQLTTLNKETWKFKGCRPAGFPTIRLAQFIHFYHHFPWHEEIWFFSVLEQIALIRFVLGEFNDPYWIAHYDFGKSRERTTGMSLNTKNGILINSLPLFLWMLADRFQDEQFRKAAIDIWTLLPAEHNELLSGWREVGIRAKNAFESQAMLEQLQQCCTKKRCLHCAIGQTLFTTFN